MSGFSFIPRTFDDHEAAPVKDTWHTEDGQPADLLRSSYPITATCTTCGGQIRLEHRLQFGWRHVPAVTAGGPS
jgi:hypothetical protein